ncbi:MAG: hypothetical protein D6690_06015 [Nitrospirae bacterium]|nr:MAG: hypothetical protein D6690_06015 [Nitrospirota bacterium]
MRDFIQQVTTSVDTLFHYPILTINQTRVTLVSLVVFLIVVSLFLVAARLVRRMLDRQQLIPLDLPAPDTRSPV